MVMQLLADPQAWIALLTVKLRGRYRRAN